jgi:hypothetical protein
MRLTDRRLAQLKKIYPASIESWPLVPGSLTTIGSNRRNRVVVRDPYASRYHAQIRMVNGAWQIEDLGSANGTQVNMESIRGTRTISDSDRITLGRTWFRFSEEPVAGPPMPHHLGLLTPQEFEVLMAGLLAAEGFSDVLVTGQSGDGGVDITARCSRPFMRGRCVVQCKRYDTRRRVPPSDVRAFHGVIAARPAVRGVFVTASSFTRGAKAFAESVGMDCIGGVELVTLLVGHNLWPF